MSEEKPARKCLGHCRKPGVNKDGYWPRMEGQFVVVHEGDCTGVVRK